jgi:hypothetical protein
MKLKLLFFLLTLSVAATAQITLTNSISSVVLDFDVEVPGAIAENWAGTGLNVNPANGELDSDFTRMENLATSTSYGGSTPVNTAVTGGVNNNTDPPAKIYCAEYPSLNKCLRMKPGEGNHPIGGGPYAKGHGEATWEFRVGWDYDLEPEPILTVDVTSAFHNDNTATDIQPMRVDWEYRIGTTGTWEELSTGTSNFANNTLGEFDDYNFFYNIDMDGVATGQDVYIRAVIVDQTGGNYTGVRNAKSDSYYISKVELAATSGILPAEYLYFSPGTICYQSANPAGPLNTYQLPFSLDVEGEVNVDAYYVEYSPDGLFWFLADGSVSGSNCQMPCNATYTGQSVTFEDLASPNTSFSRYFRVYSEDFDGYKKYYLDQIQQVHFVAGTNCFSGTGGSTFSTVGHTEQVSDISVQKNGSNWVFKTIKAPALAMLYNSNGQLIWQDTLENDTIIPLPDSSGMYFLHLPDGEQKQVFKLVQE